MLNKALRRSLTFLAVAAGIALMLPESLLRRTLERESGGVHAGIATRDDDRDRDARLEQLERRIAFMQQQAAAPQAHVAMPAPSLPAANARALDGFEQRVLEQSKQLAAEEDATQAELDAKIDGEPADAAWEAELSEQLTSIVSAGTLGQSKVESVQCSRTACRVGITHDNMQELDELPLALMGSLPRGYDSWGRSARDENGPSSNVYLTRHEVRVVERESALLGP